MSAMPLSPSPSAGSPYTEGPNTEGTESASFPPVAASIPQARRFVLEQAVGARVVDREVLSLLTSEIVTNAICHANTHFVVDVAYPYEHELTVAVTDEGPGAPHLKSPAPEDESGRGLLFVASYARAWGFEPRDNGKRVWFSLPGERLAN